MNQIPPFSAAKEKILCIQLKQIGDVLMTTPSVRVLAKTKPKAEIHFLTQVPSNQIFEFSPYLSKIILNPSRDHIQHQSLPDYEVPTIRETVTLLEQVELHVGNDNGPIILPLQQEFQPWSFLEDPF